MSSSVKNRDTKIKPTSSRNEETLSFPPVPGNSVETTKNSLAEFRLLLIRLGGTQRDASDRLGCTREYINAILNGHKSPSEILMRCLRLTVENDQLRNRRSISNAGCPIGFDLLITDSVNGFPESVRPEVAKVLSLLARQSRETQETMLQLFGKALQGPQR